jgi:hypothetical protein
MAKNFRLNGTGRNLGSVPITVKELFIICAIVRLSNTLKWKLPQFDLKTHFILYAVPNQMHCI